MKLFFQKLKREYKWYLIVALFVMLLRSFLVRGFPTDSLLSLFVVIVFRTVISAFVAFLVYSFFFSIEGMFKWTKGKLKRVSCLFLMIFLCLSMLFTPDVAEAKDQRWQAAKEAIKKGAKALALGWAVDEFFDRVDDIEDELTSMSHYAVDAVVDFFTKRTCSDCGVTYDVTLETINNGGYHPNCIARSP
ncbi:hypothetical protein J5I95_13700 [Candidatus Poribacteria bacterium]|nr:hypothetical protein [Candidatus Poribacteria bacterium]